MAPPSYTTDLTTFNLAENTGTWSEMTGYTTGGIPVTNEIDYFIQGSQCTSATMTKSGLGSIAVDFGSGVTVPTDGAILVWQYFAAPNTLDTEANGGLRILIGADITNFNGWISGGNDFSPNPYGGWNNVAINPTVTSDYTGGTGNGGTYRWVASGINLTGGIGKGNPHGVDAIRYGRCEARMNGGEDTGTPNYATFAGYSGANDALTARWGLIQSISGGYRVKGLVVFGYTSTVDFRDSNVNILIDNTKKVTANFNTFEVRQTGSRIDLTAVNITALGTVSPGRWVTTDNATQNITNCVFTDMGVFGYGSGSILTNNIYRRCGLITQNSATLASCTIAATSNTTVALLSNNPSLISTTEFTSSGTKHAIELTSATAGNSYTFSGNLFTGYSGTPGSNLVPSSGSTDAAIYNNSGGAVTLNITNGGDTPSVRNGASATTTINNNISLTVTIKNQDGNPIPGVEVAIFQDVAARTVVLASTPTDDLGVVTTSVAASLGPIIIRARQSTNSTTFLTSQAFTSELLTTVETTHNFSTGDAVVYSKNGGSAVIGLTEGTTYYVREDTANTLYLYDTAAHAVTGGATGLMNLTTNLAETHTLDPVRYVAGSATGTIGATDFSSEITLITDTIAAG